MLTIKQVADEIGCSVQAIYKKVNEQMINELKPFIKEVKRGKRTVKMISSEGVELIKASMDKAVDTTVDEPVLNSNEQLINTLNDTLHTLKSQLEVKDNQIKELNDLLRVQQELNKNNQVLLGRSQDQEQKLLESTEKKSLFYRLFKK